MKLRISQLVRDRRVQATGVLVLLGGAVVGGGAWAQFTSTATGGPQTIASGTVAITATPNLLGTGAGNIAPGDTISRAVQLNNTGTLSLSSLTLGISAAPTSLLDSNSASGLQASISECSVAWTQAGPPYTYTCGGTTTTVLASTPVATLETTPASLTGLNSLASGGKDYLVLTLSFPSATGNTYQGLTSTLTYTFSATQRAGTAQ